MHLFGIHVLSPPRRTHLITVDSRDLPKCVAPFCRIYAHVVQRHITRNLKEPLRTKPMCRVVLSRNPGIVRVHVVRLTVAFGVSRTA